MAPSRVLCSSLALQLYSTVIFALVGVYAKSAMGLALDAQCVDFLRMTHAYRQQAYQAFVAALVSFVICFETAFIASIKDWELRVRRLTSAASAAICATVVYCWFRILGHAFELVYKPRISAGL